MGIGLLQVNSAVDKKNDNVENIIMEGKEGRHINCHVKRNEEEEGGRKEGKRIYKQQQIHIS
jgi:hypothetical protein